MCSSLPGKLCISVIEARNVLADTVADLDFYVKLRLGAGEARTDVVKSESPKFLKDIRMPVPNPETDVLRMELLQVGPRGDLVVGTSELRILAVANMGTVVHWFQLRAFDQAIGAELCMVLRFLQGGANRPMSPSYAIATRHAKERAIHAAPDSPSRTMPSPSKALFSEIPSPKTTAAAYKQKMVAAEAVEREASVIAGPSTPEKRRSPAQAAAAGEAAKLKLAGGKQPKGSQARRRGSQQVPLPLAILGGILTGAAVYVLKQRPQYYEVREGDTLCTIGQCFKRNYMEIFNRNRSVLDDPDFLLPGDRLRIR